MKKESFTLTLGQIGAGSLIGLVGSWVCLLLFEAFIWRLLLGNPVSHGFWVGLFLIIAMTVTYALVIIGAGIGMRFVSGKLGVAVPLKPLCSGAFLGPPAVVGLLSLLNVPWEVFGSPNLILSVLLPVMKAAAFIISLPMRGWVYLGLPVEIWYILAIPIGAIAGYRLADGEVPEAEAEQA